MKVKAHVIVSGMVQGVYFRLKTRNKATQHGVTGWVRNLPNGKVEAVFEGEKADVVHLINFCRKGPAGARVQDLNIKCEEYKGDFRDFKVIY